jgi:hypothetical protein
MRGHLGHGCARARSWNVRFIGTAGVAVVLVFAGIALVAHSASGAGTDPELADWTAVSANTATGTLLGETITLTGTHVFDQPVSDIDSGWTAFGGPDFTPRPASTDEIQIGATTPSPETFTLSFGAAVSDPILLIGSLGSRLDFPAGTPITRLSGQTGFAVSGSSVIGTEDTNLGPDGINDANGSVQLNGTFTTISFSATGLGHAVEDGVVLQVAAVKPITTTTPTSTPPTSTPTTTSTTPGPTTPAPPPPIPAPPPTDLTPAAPVSGKTAVASVLRGIVRIERPNGSFAPLGSGTKSVPLGSTIDAIRGTVHLETNTGIHRTSKPTSSSSISTGTFSVGIFTIEQARERHTQKHGAPTARTTQVKLRSAKGAVAKAACRRTGAPGKGVIRQLHGVVKGQYQIVGAASTTITDGATFTVQDRCDGTLTHVFKGHARIAVATAHHHHRTVELNAGQSYLAVAIFAAQQHAAVH